MNADGPFADDRPRYQQVAEVLRARIAEGLHPPGTQLPTESDICAEFEVSRHTAREALRRLVDAGLIQRRQGSGSLVIAREAQQAYAHTMRSLDELFQYAADTTLRVLATGRPLPGPDVADDIGTADEGEWVAIEGLRLETGTQAPICFSLIFVNADFADVVTEIAQIRGAIYRRIEQRFGVEVAEVEQMIRVDKLPPEAARALGQRGRAMGVRVTRRYLDAAGRVIIVSINWHPADRFRYGMRMRREGARPGRG
jgi:DNA-binding GntR family transcriptional regulator